MRGRRGGGSVMLVFSCACLLAADAPDARSATAPAARSHRQNTSHRVCAPIGPGSSADGKRAQPCAAPGLQTRLRAPR
eukprot:7390055-Pyramimonas_sp.AAC.1